ncbi:nucleotidyltransferase family protein [Allohahella marinimesophila]|uniref:nucleotidyltransferase family protein n=1 Tax=Allohahella marinimesophila TaxID=1054972 RepID=UPI0031D68176
MQFPGRTLTIKLDFQRGSRSVLNQMPAERNRDRQAVLQLLVDHKQILASRFGVKAIALFGSVARNAATESSDIDVLVDFDGAASSSRYFGVQFYLEDLFGCIVDLVTTKALRPELRPYVEREAIHV